MSRLADQKVRSHLQARIFLNGVNIGTGRTQSFEADQDFGTQPVHGVSDYEAVEFVNLKFQGRITLDAFMIRQNDLIALGLAALGKKVLELGELDVELYDENGGVITTYRKCAISSHRVSIREGQICGENASCFFQTAE